MGCLCFDNDLSVKTYKQLIVHKQIFWSQRGAYYTRRQESTICHFAISAYSLSEIMKQILEAFRILSSSDHHFPFSSNKLLNTMDLFFFTKLFYYNDTNWNFSPVQTRMNLLPLLATSCFMIISNLRRSPTET